MTLNAVTDFANNSIISFSGVMNCNSGASAYVISGTGYLNTLGGISFGITVANGYFWNCATNAAFFASCRVIKSTTEQLIATPAIIFQ